MKIKISSSPFSGLVVRGSISKRFFSDFYQFNLSLKQFLISFILLFLISEASAQNFFPLKVSNAYQIQNDWSWSVHSLYDYGTDYTNLTVQSDTVINDEHFFALLNNINRYPIFNDVTLFNYDSLNQKLYVWIPSESRKRIAVDFSVPADSNFVSYIRGTGLEFTSKGISSKVIFGDSCIVYSMVHPQIIDIPYYYYEFASNIGLIKHKYYIVSTYSDDLSDQETIAAIIDSIRYNPLVLKVDSLYPIEDRPVDTFPYSLSLPYSVSYSDLVDSFFVSAEHFRTDTLIQSKRFNISKSNPHISLYLTGLLAGDKIKLRATITDTSIFYNVDHYPDTGWVVMNVLPPILSVEEGNLPLYYDLAQNYPNPFNPTTKIKYQLPEPGFVTIKVYNVLGKEIATLVSEEKPYGNYEVEFMENGLASGIYYYRITAGDFSQTKKMILLK